MTQQELDKYKLPDDLKEAARKWFIEIVLSDHNTSSKDNAEYLYKLMRVASDYCKNQLEETKKPDETPIQYVISIPVEQIEALFSQEYIDNIEKRNMFLWKLLNKEEKDE